MNYAGSGISGARSEASNKAIKSSNNTKFPITPKSALPFLFISLNPTIMPVKVIPKDKSQLMGSTPEFKSPATKKVKAISIAPMKNSLIVQIFLVIA